MVAKRRPNDRVFGPEEYGNKPSMEPFPGRLKHLKQTPKIGAAGKVG